MPSFNEELTTEIDDEATSDETKYYDNNVLDPGDNYESYMIDNEHVFIYSFTGKYKTYLGTRCNEVKITTNKGTNIPLPVGTICYKYNSPDFVGYTYLLQTNSSTGYSISNYEVIFGDSSGFFEMAEPLNNDSNETFYGQSVIYNEQGEVISTKKAGSKNIRIPNYDMIYDLNSTPPNVQLPSGGHNKNCTVFIANTNNNNLKATNRNSNVEQIIGGKVDKIKTVDIRWLTTQYIDLFCEYPDHVGNKTNSPIDPIV